MKGLVIFIVLLINSICGLSQIAVTTDNPLESPIDSVVQIAVLPFMNSPGRASLSIGIIKDGKTFFYNYGTGHNGKKELPSKFTVYEIGSISKTFTGLLLAQAIVEGKLKLQDDVRRYVPGSYPNLAYQGKGIKVLNLTNHTSGLPAFLPDRPDLFQRPKDSIPFLLDQLHRNYTKSLFLKDLHGVQIDTIPGFNYRYSNSAAQLLGFILEHIYKKNFGELIRQYITIPFSMKRTKASFRSSLPGVSKGYNASGMVMPYMPVLMKPSGGIYSTTDDMINYIGFQLNEENKAVRLSHTLTQQYTDSTGIGFFWRINKVAGNIRRIWHTGGTFGFSSYCVLYPERKLGIILLSNEFDETSQQGLIEIADKLFERF